RRRSGARARPGAAPGFPDAPAYRCPLRPCRFAPLCEAAAGHLPVRRATKSRRRSATLRAPSDGVNAAVRRLAQPAGIATTRRRATPGGASQTLDRLDDRACGTATQETVNGAKMARFRPYRSPHALSDPRVATRLNLPAQPLRRRQRAD